MKQFGTFGTIVVGSIAAAILSLAGVAHASTYTLSLTVSASSSRPGTYTAVVNVDTSALTGVGAETAPLVVTSFDYPLESPQVCTNVPGTAYFANGSLTSIGAVCGGAWGFNGGFNCGDILGFGIDCSANWFGSLDGATFVDGAGNFTVTPTYPFGTVSVDLGGVSAILPPHRLSAGTITCKNLTTRAKAVKIKAVAGQRNWNCTAAGLVVNPGDNVKITVSVKTAAD